MELTADVLRFQSYSSGFVLPFLEDFLSIFTLLTEGSCFKMLDTRAYSFSKLNEFCSGLVTSELPMACLIICSLYETILNSSSTFELLHPSVNAQPSLLT